MVCASNFPFMLTNIIIYNIGNILYEYDWSMKHNLSGKKIKLLFREIFFFYLVFYYILASLILFLKCRFGWSYTLIISRPIHSRQWGTRHFAPHASVVAILLRIAILLGLCTMTWSLYGLMQLLFLSMHWIAGVGQSFTDHLHNNKCTDLILCVKSPLWTSVDLFLSSKPGALRVRPCLVL